MAPRGSQLGQPDPAQGVELRMRIEVATDCRCPRPETAMQTALPCHEMALQRHATSSDGKIKVSQIGVADASADRCRFLRTVPQHRLARILALIDAACGS